MKKIKLVIQIGLTPSQAPGAKISFPNWHVRPEDLSLCLKSAGTGIGSRYGPATNIAQDASWNDTFGKYFVKYTYLQQNNGSGWAYGKAHGMYGQFIWDISYDITIGYGDFCWSEYCFVTIHKYQGFTRPRALIDYEQVSSSGVEDWGLTNQLELWRLYSNGGRYRFVAGTGDVGTLRQYALPNFSGTIPGSTIQNTHTPSETYYAMQCGGNVGFGGYTQPDDYLQLYSGGDSGFHMIPSGQDCNPHGATKPYFASATEMDIKPHLPRPGPGMTPWPWLGENEKETYAPVPTNPDPLGTSLPPNNYLLFDYERCGKRFQNGYNTGYFVKVEVQFKTCAQRLMECYDGSNLTQSKGYWGEVNKSNYKIMDTNSPTGASQEGPPGSIMRCGNWFGLRGPSANPYNIPLWPCNL